MLKNKPIFIDLFSGGGGFSLGFRSAGFHPIAAIEKDPSIALTYSKNFPLTQTIICDLRGITGREVRNLANLGSKEIDLVCFSPPCQPYSSDGHRNERDSRRSLLPDSFRLVSELRPKYFVMENVPGLIQKTSLSFLEESLNWICDRGYQIAPIKILDSSQYGVAQKRKRVFVFGARNDFPLPSYPAPHHRKVTVEEAIGDLPNIDDFPELLDSDTILLPNKKISTYEIWLDRELSENPNPFLSTEEPYLLTQSRRTIHSEEVKKRFANIKPGERDKISRFFKLDSQGQSRTIKAGNTSRKYGCHTAARGIHPEHPRVISVRESARLQSFPDSYYLGSVKYASLMLLGNSVAPLIAKAIALEIKKNL